jgi:hypothetical protein
VQQHLRSLIQILEVTGVPDGFDSVVRSRFPHLIWADVLNSAKLITDIAVDDSSSDDDSSSASEIVQVVNMTDNIDNVLSVSQKRSWFEEIFGSEARFNTMSFTHVPACKKPLFLCSEHQKWFNHHHDDESSLLADSYDLSDESVQIISYIAKVTTLILINYLLIIL